MIRSLLQAGLKPPTLPPCAGLPFQGGDCPRSWGTWPEPLPSQVSLDSAFPQDHLYIPDIWRSGPGSEDGTVEEAAWNGEQRPLQQEPREGGPLAPVEGLGRGTKAPLCKKVVQRQEE